MEFSDDVNFAPLNYLREHKASDLTQTERNQWKSLIAKLWLAPIVRPRNGKNKVHLGECGRL